MPKVTASYEQSRRLQIVQAAARCFTRQGYEQTSIDDICHEAEISKGGLYTYFKSKELLFAAVCRGEWLRGFEELAESVAGKRTVEAKLNAYADFAFGQLGSDPDLILQSTRMSMEVWNEAAKNQDIRELILDTYSAWFSALESVLREGQESGEISADLDAEALAVVLVAAFDGMQVHQAISPKPLSVGRIKQTLVRLVKGGILAK